MNEERNKLWLENRPMWKVDKTNPKLCKHPKRWLSHCRAWLSSPRYGWLHMPSIIRHTEIQNSIAKRGKK